VVIAIADDAGTAPAMTAASIGEQRTEMLRKDG
jgi:beta-N-acetylhexosaminidase